MKKAKQLKDEAMGKDGNEIEFDARPKVVDEITRHFERRVKDEVNRTLADMNKQLNDMGAPDGCNVVHRLQRLASIHADDKAVTFQASQAHQALDEAGVPDGVPVSNDKERTLTLAERVEHLVKVSEQSKETIAKQGHTIRNLRALNEWHTSNVRPPHEPNQPRPIASVFDELRILRNGVIAAHEKLDKAGGNAKPTLAVIDGTRTANHVTNSLVDRVATPKALTGMEVQAMCELDKANIPLLEGDTLCSRVRRLVGELEEARAAKLKVGKYEIKLDDGVVSRAIREAIEARMDAEGVRKIRANVGTQCEVRVRDPEGGESFFYGDHIDVENYLGGTRLNIKRPDWIGPALSGIKQG